MVSSSVRRATSLLGRELTGVARSRSSSSAASCFTHSTSIRLSGMSTPGHCRRCCPVGCRRLLTVSSFGPFTAAAGLVLLFFVVLAAPPPRQDFIPWLPLFIASVSLTTVVIYRISQQMGPRPLSVAAEDDFSGVSVDAGGGPSFRSLSTQRGPPSESYRNQSHFFARHGPSSRTSYRTDTDTSGISLAGVAGQVQPQWDPLTRSYFSPAVLPNQTSPDEPQTLNGSTEGQSSQAQDMSPDEEPETDPETDPERNLPMDSDSDSEHETVESSQPLLGSH